ncbi:MAG: relaxase/mobilization nuclease domain-containing protein [Oscillospiraceae bacterium]|nr:relaxase/mobilization nuclease domain-containing protein [Oscillospiraceae bacterium]
MATTGFWPVKSRLKDVIDYAENPDKTIDRKCVDEDLWYVIRYAENDNKTDKKMYVSGINCSPKTAYEQMSATKARFGKQGGNVAYHGYQSFKTGEVTPEEAHQIGIRTAKRMWGGRFEIVVTTHLNTDNIHNHIVINSVSFVDGKKYENHIRDHIALREESDEICEEYGKSVLKNSNFYSKGKKKEYWIHKNGGMTHRDMLKRDIDEALSVAMTRQQFDRQLMMLGYRYVRNGNYAHPSIIAPGWKRAVRIDSLGEKYTEENIRKRILQNPNHPEFEPRNWIRKPKTPLYEIEIEFRKAMQMDAIQLLMQIFIDMLLHALNLDTPERKRPVSPLLRDEVRKLDKYNEQIRLLAGFEIETGEELLSFIEETEEKIKALENERQKIYNKIRRVKTPEEEEKLKQKAKDISAEIAPLRKRKKTAEEIAENIPKIKELLKTEMEMEVSVLQKENTRQRSRER